MGISWDNNKATQCYYWPQKGQVGGGGDYFGYYSRKYEVRVLWAKQKHFSFQITIYKYSLVTKLRNYIDRKFTYKQIKEL